MISQNQRVSDVICVQLNLFNLIETKTQCLDGFAMLYYTEYFKNCVDVLLMIVLAVLVRDVVDWGT